jgi:hypothetical protein
MIITGGNIHAQLVLRGGMRINNMKLTIKQKIRMLFLTIKYWNQGDTWDEAKDFAFRIVYWR